MEASAPATEAAGVTAGFDEVERALRSDGPGAAIDRLIAELEQAGPPRSLLDALLLKARHELGLPLIVAGPAADWPQPAREAYEDRYVAAIRKVGTKLLAGGDLVGAWPYFRAIAEKEPIAAALDAYRPPEGGDDALGNIIEVAFNQGRTRARGFELILENYGACSAITAFEHLPGEDAVRVPCADRLVRHLHEQLTYSLRSDIERRGQVMPPEGTPIAGLVEGREWLFADDGYHIDLSHLAAVVRSSPLLTDPATLAMAADLCEYGRLLSDRHRYDGEPPFEDLYNDHLVYLKALHGRDVDAAVEHFRGKLRAAAEADAAESGPEPGQGPGRDVLIAAQVLVRLLERLGRLDEAIEVSAEHLAGLPDGALGCSTLPVLCDRAGRLDRLAEVARRQGDLVHYAAALLHGGAGPLS